MKKIISTAMIIMITTLPTISYGQQIAPLHEGEEAPFSGILLSPEAHAKVQAQIESIPQRLELARLEEKKLCEARCEFKVNEVKTDLTTEKRILEVKLDAVLKENNVLTQRIKKIEDDKPNTMLWYIGGVLSGALLSIGTVFIVK